MKYRKKPVVIEAVKWIGSQKSFEEVRQFFPDIMDGGAVWYPDAPANLEVKTDSWPLFIQTLEGTMSAQIGDYIIKGVNGEFYPCKPDIFEKTYQAESEGCESYPKNKFNFGIALRYLQEGKAVARSGWNGKGMFVVKQIPAQIGLDIIPKMQSLPQSAKDILLGREQPISYTNQMLIINADGRADSWVPSSSDCFAEDWNIVE